MKKIIVLTLALCLSQALFSKVLIVRRFGYGGAFWNIEQAVDSASEGDTVYVDMRGETSYWGNPVIRKNITLSISDTSLSINSISIETNLFYLQNIKTEYVSFKGFKLFLNNCKLNTLSIDKGSVGINNCKLRSFTSYDSTSEIKFINSEFTDPNGDSNCDIICNSILFCGNILPNNTKLISKKGIVNGNKNGIYFSRFEIYSDEICCLGNIIRSINFDKLIIESKEGNVCNNLFVKDKPGFLRYDYFNNFSITETEMKGNPLVIMNNYFAVFYNFSPGYITQVMSLNSQLASSNILNIDISTTFNYYPPLSNNSIINANIGNPNWGNFLDSSVKKLAIPFSNAFLDADYRFVYDSTLVTNRGFDDPAYSDLDLTRNDIGPLGGPTPITNYQNPGGAPKPQIWDVTLPRRTFSPSGPIPIKAVGTAK